MYNFINKNYYMYIWPADYMTDKVNDFPFIAYCKLQ